MKIKSLINLVLFVGFVICFIGCIKTGNGGDYNTLFSGLMTIAGIILCFTSYYFRILAKSVLGFLCVICSIALAVFVVDKAINATNNVLKD